jgi:hypothetical protein
MLGTRRPFTALVILIATLALTAGCGGTSSPGVRESTGATPFQSRVLFGRVLLDQPPTGAIVQVADLNGEDLGLPDGTVDETGNFYIPIRGAALPEELRIQVSPSPGSPWDLPIVAIVPSGRAAFCNILTTAAVLYRERHQSSQSAAEAWARRTFEIPEGVPLGSGVDESTRSDFRHADFLERARGRGGPAAHLAALLAASDSSFEFGIVSTIAINLVADLGSDAIGAGTGRIAQALGLNTGNSQEIQEATEDLAEIQAEISQLSSEISADFAQLERELRTVAEAAADLLLYQQLTTSLQPYTIAISNRSLNLLTLSATNPITNSPFIPDSGVTAFLSNLANFDVATALKVISDTLLGQEDLGLLQVYRQLDAFRFGVTPPADPTQQPVYEQTPVISNTLNFNSYERVFRYYLLHQVLGLNLLVENANASLEPSIIEDSRLTAAQFNTNVPLQAQVAGLPLASDSYLSLTNTVSKQRTRQPLPATPSATIYYTQIQAPFPAYGAPPPVGDGGLGMVDIADKFEAPGYSGGWQITNLDDINFLRELALQANPTDVLAGLQELGFTAPSGWDGSIWFIDYENPYIQGIDPNTFYHVSENDYIKLYNFKTNQTTGYNITDMAPLYYASYPYIFKRYQGYGVDENYRNLVAAGFRPTAELSIGLSADGSEVQAFLNGDQNVTPFCSFTSSNPGQLELLFTEENSAKLVWHPAAGALTNQTITATLEGMNSDGIVRTLTASTAVQVPSPAPRRTMTNLVLTPGNKILLDPSEQTVFKATAFFDDRSVENVTNQVTSWSLELPNGQPYPSGEATINGTVPGILIFNTQAFIVDPIVVVKAALDTGNGIVTGQTQLEVSLP